MPKTTSNLSLKCSALTINRKGQVDWSVTGDTHCGPKSELRDGKIPVKYELNCKCLPTLDQRGFLFDQAMVDLWMRRMASRVTSLSCESLVVHVAEQFLAKMAHDVP